MRGLLLPALAVAIAIAVAGCSSSSKAPVVCGPATEDPPNDLACTGLYADFDAKTVAKTARPYAPAVSFWSDGYEKARWIELPDGQAIDASDMDDWKFPAGTKVWKEFSAHGRRIETRLLWKVNADRWVLAAYVWSEDGTSATRGEGKDLTIDGTPYHVPTGNECNDCHKGRRDVLLGFEALSLAQASATGVTLATLAQESRIAPPPSKTAITLDPGVAVLHVNCGVSCHNATSAATRHDSTLRLRIGFDEAATKPVDQWELYGTTVGVPAALPLWNRGPIITPGAPDRSVIVAAMTSNDATGKMPPTARTVDTDGVAKVEAFVRALPPR